MHIFLGNLDREIIEGSNAGELINSIIVEMRLSSIHSKGYMFSNMTCFVVLQFFRSCWRSKNSNKIIETLWQTSSIGWVKGNIDGSVVGSPSIAIIRESFGDHRYKFLGAFSQNIGHPNALFV